VHLGPVCPQTRSLRATHHREPSANICDLSVLSQSIEATVPGGVTGSREATVDVGFHRVGRRHSFRFATGSASSFSICTGLAGATTLPLFTLSRFWSCYRSLESFLSKVRPFTLKGDLLPTFLYFVEIQLVVRRRTQMSHVPIGIIHRSQLGVDVKHNGSMQVLAAGYYERRHKI
jgi:hypothetical protein